MRKPIPMTRAPFAALMLMLALALTACPQSSDDANPDASTSTEGTASTELATSSAPTSSAAPTTTTSTIPTPPVWEAVQPGPGNSGAFLGLSTGLSRSERAPRFRSIEEASGRTYDIGQVFHAWDMAIPTSDDLMHISDNRLLMISWNGTDTIEIAAGDHDDWIRTQARATRDLGVRVLFRWLWEMDGRRRIEVVHSGPDYVAAWNHVRSIFTEEGATNAEFVWCPNEFLFWDDGDPEPLYPGDENVDWLCADGYNWGTTEDGDDWTDLVDIFGDFYAWAEPRGKPIVIGETGSGEAEAGAKAAWFRQIPETLRTELPEIDAVVYFDKDFRDFGFIDWRVDTSEDAYAAWLEISGDPWLNAGAP